MVGGRRQGDGCFRWENSKNKRIKAERAETMDTSLTIAEGSCLDAVRENLGGCRVLKAR